ncbi:MAG: Maf family nucleotide pyrophosphatase [Gammaproteobacteria bacterium SHHR-1]|uniref:Maf family protein n=1 Tax=Magnetovirga frankeli TaxID=947516 RepID=UPI00129360C5|nr:septum formation inhibitor Maf [gamma proteobacterium SS-5]
MPEPLLYLASASPRRAELLRQIGVSFQPYPAHIDETPRLSESATDFVLRMAQEKAQAAQARLRDPQARVLGADTDVILDGEILGKPADQAQAAAMLRRLSGRSHEVLSGVALADAKGLDWRLSRSRVWFRALSEAEITAYWASGEPLGKAGGYAIQGLGAVFIERLEGSYSGVMGLPLFETAQLLRP